MNVASLELCKELYELSGWETGSWIGDFERYRPAADGHVEAIGESAAYDLGYLMRKLPTLPNYGAPYVGQSNGGDDYIASFMNWWAMWEYGGKGEGKRWHNEIVDKGFHKKAEAPEDAACQLAIELFKQGILKRD